MKKIHFHMVRIWKDVLESNIKPEDEHSLIVKYANSLYGEVDDLTNALTNKRAKHTVIDRCCRVVWYLSLTCMRVKTNAPIENTIKPAFIDAVKDYKKGDYRQVARSLIDSVDKYLNGLNRRFPDWGDINNNIAYIVGTCEYIVNDLVSDKHGFDKAFNETILSFYSNIVELNMNLLSNTGKVNSLPAKNIDVYYDPDYDNLAGSETKTTDEIPDEIKEISLAMANVITHSKGKSPNLGDIEVMMNTFTKLISSK